MDQISRCAALVPAPYSSDLNPIEQAFSKIKHWMRNAQKRTIDDTWRHIGRLVETIQPDESGLIHPQIEPETPVFQCTKSLKSFDDGQTCRVRGRADLEAAADCRVTSQCKSTVPAPDVQKTAVDAPAPGNRRDIHIRLRGFR